MRATLHPAETPGAGVVFRLPSANGSPQEIVAQASNVVEAVRCTVLGSMDGARLSTVEHLLSAIAGLGITDALVEVDGPELPIGDGSAQLWVDALGEAGGAECDGEVSVRTLDAPLFVSGSGGAFIAAYPSSELRLTSAISFEHRLIGTQVARFEAVRHDYAAEVAPARTFGFEAEVAALLASGLARGGSLDNAIVVYDDRFSVPLRFPDELARHKLLDLIGDLYLVGGPIAADVIAYRPSHRLNTEFARLWQS